MSLMISIPVCWSQTQRAQIQGFNFIYNDVRGEGVATHFTFDSRPSSQTKQKVVMEKIFNDMKISLSGVHNEEILVQNAPDFLLSAQKMNLKDFNLSLNEKLTISFQETYLKSYQEETHAQSMVMDCDRMAQKTSLKEQLVYGCLQMLNMRVSKLLSVMGFLDFLAPSSDPLNLRNLELKMRHGVFEFTGEVGDYLPGKLKGKGTATYDPQNFKLKVTIPEIRYGFVNVTTLFFDELKRSESDQMKVERPNIYISLN